MSLMGTFDTFTTARLGIYAAQKGLAVTGNNISNINTTGYTRQVLQQVALKTGGSDRYQSEYDAHVGTGVICIGVNQIRDQYLDIRYRTEMANVGSLDAKLSGLDELASILDEVGDGENAGDGIIEAQLSDLLTTLENLDLNAGQDEFDAQVRASASSLCVLLNSYAKQLEEVKTNTESWMDQSVDEVNEILANIRELNVQIRKSEIHGDNALEMRDDRNVLIDQLSEYMKIDVTYEMEDLGGGQQVEKLVIKLGNANSDPAVETDSSTLVDGIYAVQLMSPKVNPDYDANDPNNNGLYLKADGTQTNDPLEAAREYDSNYNLQLSKLLDTKGREWTQELSTTEASDTTLPNLGTPDSLVVANTDAAGNQVLTTYEKVLDKNGKLDYYNKTVETTDATTGQVTTTTPTQVKEADFTADYQQLLVDGASFRVENVDQTTMQQTVVSGTVTSVTDQQTNTTTTTYDTQTTVTQLAQVVTLDDNDLYGSLQSIRELLTESGEFASADTIANVDESAATKRGIPYYQKALDLLANQIATQFNKLNQGYLMNTDGDYVDADGNALQYTDAVGTMMTLNSSMTLDPDQKAFLEQNGIAIDDAGVLFSNSGDGDDAGGITASNISISKSWAEGTVHIVKSYTETIPGGGVPTTASDNIDHFITLMNKRLDYTANAVDGNARNEVIFNGSFQEMLTNISAVLGNDIRSSTVMLNTYESAATELDTSRESVSGVDLNDEAMNMIQYQKAYSAACRLMTVLDEALEKLINGTGVAGL
jgi:flagellar hook-associated protein 1 FlgK